MASQQASRADLSILISTYNRAVQLRGCLESLCEIRVPNLAQIECIICDDGSSDDTLAIAKSFENRLSIRYCYQADQGYRLAAARNMGVRLSSGRLLLFLDSDVIAAPNLVQEHLLTHALADKPIVVVGPTHGYQVPPAIVMQYLESGQSNWWEQIGTLEQMADIRTAVWESVDYQIEALSEPWTMMMGSNFSVLRDRLILAGAFDELLEGWGAEDTDLAYRLHCLGIVFRVNRNAQTLHLPHQRSASQTSIYRQNKRSLYHKSPGLITELLPLFRVTTYSQRIDEIRSIARRSLVPDYLASWDQVFQSRLRSLVTDPCYLFGGSHGDLVSFLGCAWMSDPDQQKVDHARLNHPWVQVRCGVGTNTDMDSRFVETALITDFWRAFNEDITLALVAEARRIAKRVILLYTPDFAAPRMESVPLWSPEGLAILLREKAACELSEIVGEGATRVYDVLQQSPEE